MGKGATNARAALGLGLLATLAACGKQQPALEVPRPVLVVHPLAGADTAPAAYAGDIRARNESPLSFRVGGNLTRRLVDAGDRVRRGQLLAELDPGDAGLQASAAHAEMTRLGGDLERYRTLVAQKLVSQSTFDAQQAAYRAARAQYELTRNQSAYTRLLAPADGVIATRSAEAGQTVAAGQAIYTLAGDSGREVAIALPESRVREVRVGQPVVVELWSAPGQPLPGRIREISPAADPQARTFAARVALEGDAAPGRSWTRPTPPGRSVPTVPMPIMRTMPHSRVGAIAPTSSTMAVRARRSAKCSSAATRGLPRTVPSANTRSRGWPGKAANACARSGENA